MPVVIDGAHGPGNLALDLAALAKAGAVAYPGHCHKWLCAPKNAGFLWTRPDWQDRVRPTVIGNYHGEGYSEAFLWPGTHDPGAWLAVSAALDFQTEFGPENIRGYCHGLAGEAAAMLADEWGTRRGTPPAMASAMTAVALPLDLPADLQTAGRLGRTLCHDHPLELPVIPLAGRLWARLSVFLYNETEDYRRLAAAVGQL